MVVAYSAVPAIGTSVPSSGSEARGAFIEIDRVVEIFRADVTDHQRVAVGVGLEQLPRKPMTPLAAPRLVFGATA